MFFQLFYLLLQLGDLLLQVVDCLLLLGYGLLLLLDDFFLLVSVAESGCRHLLFDTPFAYKQVFALADKTVHHRINAISQGECHIG